MCRRPDVERPHHGHELSAIGFLQSRVGGDFFADGGAGASLVLVGRMNVCCGIELQQFSEQALIEPLRIAGGEVGPPGSTHEKGVSGEDMVVDDQAGRVRGVAGCRHGLDAEVADDQQIAIIEADIHKGRRRQVAHHHLRVQRLADLARRGEVICMRVRVDRVADGEAMFRGEAAIALDGADFRVDNSGNVRFGASEQVGAAAADFDGFEDHALPLPRLVF